MNPELKRRLIKLLKTKDAIRGYIWIILGDFLNNIIFWFNIPNKIFGFEGSIQGLAGMYDSIGAISITFGFYGLLIIANSVLDLSNIKLKEIS